MDIFRMKIISSKTKVPSYSPEKTYLFNFKTGLSVSAPQYEIKQMYEWMDYQYEWVEFERLTIKSIS